MKTKVIKYSLALFIILFVYQFSYADGCFIPEAGKKIPDIPVQRALVKYRGGIETLIIESALDGDGGDYGWIIPVPSRPNRFEKFSPGLLKTLSLQIQPKIHHEKPHGKLFGIRFTTIITILIVISCLCNMLWGAKGSIIPVIILCLSIFAYTNFVKYKSGPGFTSIADPSVISTISEIEGNYEVFVLETKESSVLNTWLEKNGFNKFPPEATKLIDEYMSHDWFFVVAKLRTIMDGNATPHPILLEFGTDRPVYPMKLTMIPGSTVYLELYVVGVYEAIPVNYDIKKEYCNFFDYGKMYQSRDRVRSETSIGFKPRKIFGPYKEIAHSDALNVMWDGCVVTKFADKITSDEMNEDMFFDFKEANPFRSEMYSSVGKFDLAYNVVLAVLAIGSILLAIYHRSKKSLGNEVSISKLFIILLISSITGFGLSYLLVGETAAVYSVERYWPQIFQVRLCYLFSDPENTFSTGEELIELLHREGIDNPLTKEAIIIEDSPGNIILEETEGKNLIKICLENGSFYKF